MREDPPSTALGHYERRARPSVWFEILAEAVADPGHWHRLAGDHDPTQFRRLVRAAEHRSSKYPRLPPGRWEFKRDEIPQRYRIVIWARVTPEEDHQP